MRIVPAVIVMGLVGSTTTGQTPAQPPVIDVHVHSTNTSPQQALERMKFLNIRFLVVSSLTSDLPQWASALDVAQDWSFHAPMAVHRSLGARASTAVRSFPTSPG